MFRKLCLTLLIASCVQCHAQKHVSPAVSVRAIIQPFHTSFMAVVNAMPAEKFDFSPAQLNLPDSQFKGVRTFAEEVRHVARANYAIAGGVGYQAPQSELTLLASAKSKQELAAAASASFAAVDKAIGTLTEANQDDEIADGVSGTGHDSRIMMAAYVAVHGYDHYGQMVEYLRMAGIIPPGSK